MWSRAVRIFYNTLSFPYVLVYFQEHKIDKETPTVMYMLFEIKEY